MVVLRREINLGSGLFCKKDGARVRRRQTSLNGPSGRVPSSLTRSEHGGRQNDHRNGRSGKKRNESGPHQADSSGKCQRTTALAMETFPKPFSNLVQTNISGSNQPCLLLGRGNTFRVEAPLRVSEL